MKLEKVIYSHLFSFLEKFAQLSEEEKQRLFTISEVRQVSKGTFLEKPGRKATQLRFVFSGVYRVYQIMEGKEITSYFHYAFRNPVIGAFESLLTEESSKVYVECLVPGTLIELRYKDWVTLYKESLSFTNIARIFAEKNYVLALERIESLQYQSASDRYALFLKQYPSLLQQIPQHYVASYLGIAPESLSRIRKKTVLK